MTARLYLLIVGWTALFAFMLGVLGPTLDDIDEARATAATLQDVEAAAQREARLQAASEALCGPHASARQTKDGAWACLNKRGQKAVLTARVQL